MGCWDVGAFDNDRALDTLAMLENVNGPGVNAFLWTALDSTYEEIVVLAIALIDIIHKGNVDDYQHSLGTLMTENNVLNVAEDDKKLRREAFYKVCYLIEQGNVLNWKDWSNRKKYLLGLKESLSNG